MLYNKITTKLLLGSLVKSYTKTLIHNCFFQETTTQFFQNNSKTVIQLLYKCPKKTYNSITVELVRKDGSVKTMQSKVLKKEIAEECFDDSMASGNVAFVARKENEELVELDIGNVMPGTKVNVRLVSVGVLDVRRKGNAGFVLRFDLENERNVGRKKSNYKARNNIEIDLKMDNGCSIKNIKSINHSNVSIVSVSGENEYLIKSVDRFSNQKNFILEFECDKLPNISWESEKKSKNLYCHAISILPYFDNINNIYKEEIIIIVDRSGSMSGKRMDLTKRSLKLLFHSLDIEKHIKFNIISFGSKFSSLFEESKDLNEENFKIAIEHITEFKANYGATRMLLPLKSAVMNKRLNDYERKVYLMTDGRADDGDSNIINFVKKECKKTRIFTFGIGREVNKNFLTQIANISSAQEVFVENNKDIEDAILFQLENSSSMTFSDLKIDFPKSMECKELDVDENIYILGRMYYKYFFSKHYEGNEKVDVLMKCCGNEMKFSLSKSNKNCMIATLAASNRVDYLETQKDALYEIQHLGEEFNLITSQTSFFLEIENKETIKNTPNIVNVIDYFNFKTIKEPGLLKDLFKRRRISEEKKEEERRKKEEERRKKEEERRKKEEERRKREEERRKKEEERRRKAGNGYASSTIRYRQDMLIEFNERLDNDKYSFRYEEGVGIVIDNGSGFIKCGFSGDEHPKVVLPSVVGRPKNPSLIRGTKDLWIGEDAQAKRNVLKIKHPIKHGMITNWNDMEHIWHQLFYDELRITPEEHPIFITEYPMNNKNSKEKMRSILFETFNVPAVHVCSSGVLPLYTSGKTTGIALNVGYDSTIAVPIDEGYEKSNAIESMKKGGKDITEYYMNELDKRKIDIPSSTGYKIDIAKDIKETVSYVALNYNDELKKSDLDKIYVLPDEKSISIKSEMFQAPEVLFQPKRMIGFDHNGIVDLLVNSIQKCDQNIRKDMFSNIILSGGTSFIKGMNERITKEMNILYPKNKVDIVQSCKYATWVGGSILSSLSTFQNIWTTKDEYDDAGATIVHRKCFGGSNSGYSHNFPTIFESRSTLNGSNISSSAKRFIVSKKKPVEFKPNQSSNVKGKLNLTDILFACEYNGIWKYNEDLLKIIDCTSEYFRSHCPSSNINLDYWISAIILYILQLVFGDLESKWKFIAKKTRRELQRNSFTIYFKNAQQFVKDLYN